MATTSDNQFTFSILKDLAQKSTDEAALKFKMASDAYSRGQEKLNTLNGYYQEYKQRLNEALTTGINGTELANFQAFISTMEKSITQQKQLLITLSVKQKQALNQLNLYQKKLNAYTTLIEKKQKELSKLENRIQQKLNDEFAQKKSVRRMAHEY